MAVIATAGHVDHGKSTLVRALTGMEPDRLADERRRGMTIDLGYAWTSLPDGTLVSFVDVPGHQRFIANMLAGLGPTPAVLFVVAADRGWQPQSSDHLTAMSALGVRQVVVAITQCDRADPSSAAAAARARFAEAGLPEPAIVAVSARDGLGLDELRLRLVDLVASQRESDVSAPVRFWIDRAFDVRGAGRVVTGTLAAGSITIGDQLTLGSEIVTIRALQCHGADVAGAGPVTRVALNLRGRPASDAARGAVLTTPDRFIFSDTIDVAIEFAPAIPSQLMLHVGTAGVPARVRPIGQNFARLTLSRQLPLRVGDRAVLRDPTSRTVLGGVVVLDVDPPVLRRRGAARDRAAFLLRSDGVPTAQAEVERRGVVRRERLEQAGYDTASVAETAGWLVSSEQLGTWTREASTELSRWAATHPLAPRMPRAALRRALDVPDDALLDAVLAAAGLGAGCARIGGDGDHDLGPAEKGLIALAEHFERQPFAAPDADMLARLGLGRRELAAAARFGRLLRLDGNVVLPIDAPARAAAVLGRLGTPFTVSEAKVALATSRRVAIPLLEHLDQLSVTQRDNNDPNYRMITQGKQ